jgi:ferritin
MTDVPNNFEVIKAFNGWMVREIVGHNQYLNLNQVWVFSTIAGMTSWMTQNLKEPSNDNQD